MVTRIKTKVHCILSGVKPNNNTTPESTTKGVERMKNDGYFPVRMIMAYILVIHGGMVECCTNNWFFIIHTETSCSRSSNKRVCMGRHPTLRRLISLF